MSAGGSPRRGYVSSDRNDQNVRAYIGQRAKYSKEDSDAVRPLGTQEDAGSCVHLCCLGTPTIATRSLLCVRIQWPVVDH